MKANEIIKNKGIEYIRDILIKYPDFTHMTDDARMFINEKNCIEFIKKDLHNTVKFSELRKIIESHDLVGIWGYEKSKEIVANAPSDDLYYSWKLGNSEIYDKTVNVGELRKAIADVESCQ